MALYDEEKALEEIRRMPVEARLHLSHVVRNSFCVIAALHRLGGDVGRAIEEFERKWREMGL